MAMAEDESQCQQREETSLSVSMLEQLPNELLADIFSHLSHCYLYDSIYNLNTRLKQLCHGQKLHLDLTSTKSAYYAFCHSPQPLILQIYSMKLSDEFDRLTLFNRLVDISTFANLRALTISYPSPENFDKILSKLHLLLHLSCLNIYEALIQSIRITKTLFSLQSLKRLAIYSSEPVIFNFTHDTLCPSTTLEYLEIYGCYMVEFIALLKFVGPRINQMKISINYRRDEDPDAIDERTIDSLICDDDGLRRIPVSLTRLQMSFNFLQFTDLLEVLKLFPNLKHLTLSVLSSELDFVSAAEWQQFISTYILKLEKFQFHMRIESSNVTQSQLSVLAHSFYEMNSQWIDGAVIMDYNFRLNPPLLEFYTHSQPTKSGKYSSEFYGKQRCVIPDDSLANPDENATQLVVTLNDDLTLRNDTPAKYTKVTDIRIHSQMTNIVMGNESLNSLIASDMKTSISDLSKVTTLGFTTHQSIDSTYPSTDFAHHILTLLPNVEFLYLPYKYLLQLVKSLALRQKLVTQIKTLWITVDNSSPSFEEMIRILLMFSKNLCFLYFEFLIEFPSITFYLILPLLLRDLCNELIGVRTTLFHDTIQQRQGVFVEEFQTWFKRYFMNFAKNNEQKSSSLEYRITDKEFSISLK